MKGYNLQQPYCTSFSLSHGLSHTITLIVLQCYNTIQNCITILSFYKGITMGKYHGSPNTMGLQTIGKQTSQKFLSGCRWPPQPPLGQVYSKIVVQTQLNNNILLIKKIRLHNQKSPT